MGARRTAGLALLLAALAVPAQAQGQTLHVDTASLGGTCSDDRAADEVTAATPLCSLARGLALVADGGTVLVRAGRYPRLTSGRAHAAATTVRAAPGEQPEVAGLHLLPSARNLRMEGFRVTDISEVFGEGIRIAGNDHSPHGIVLWGNRNVVEGNHIHDLRIHFDADSTAPRCHNNWRLDGENDRDGDGQYDIPLSRTGGIAPRCGHALRVQGAGHVVRGNTVRKVPADGVQAHLTSDLLVENNRFEDIAIQSTEDGGDPLEHPDGAQPLGANARTTFRGNVYVDTRGILPMAYKGAWPTDMVIENTVFHTATKYTGVGNGCIHASAVERLRIQNVTCWGTGNFDPRVRISDDPETPTSGVVVRNTITERLVVEGDVGLDEDFNLVRSWEAPGRARGAHTAIGSPTFAAGDVLLRLAPGSVGIDAGSTDGAPATDREGQARCRAVDVGADELGAPGASCAATSYADVVRAAGPVAWWRLGERTGTAARDAIAVRHGTYLSSFALGQPGAASGDTAVRFAGGRVSVPDAAVLDTGDTFSVELWVRLGRLGVSHGLAAKGGWQVFVDARGFVTLRKSGVGPVVRATVPIADTTAFHHVVVTKAGPQARVLLDGVDRSGPVTNRTLVNSTASLLLGGGYAALTGTLDEAALYARALTPAEAAAHAAAR